IWHDVMTPRMIRQLPARHALVIRGSCAPVIARLEAAWNDRRYKLYRGRGLAVASLPPAPGQPPEPPPAHPDVPDPPPGPPRRPLAPGGGPDDGPASADASPWSYRHARA